MPVDQGTQVSPNGANGSGNGMGSGGFGGDAGPDELDQRLNQRIQKEWDQFRSVTDRRFATVDQMRGEMNQLRQQNQQLLNQVQTISGYLTSAQEADLDPEERERRQASRVQQTWLNERQQLALNARQQNAAFKVVSKISKWGFEWNDPRLNWYADLYASDPDGWASQVIADAADQAVTLRTEAQRQTAETTQRSQQVRSQETQQRQQVDQQNQTRATQAQALDTTVPGGPQIGFLERVQAMSPEERKDWIRRTQNKIKHKQIEHPSQSL